MSSHNLVGLDLEDLTPRQLRQLLRSAATSSMLRKDRSEKEKEEEDDDAANENDDLVDLHEEKKGKSGAPKVRSDDLPEGIEVEEEEEEEEEEKAPKKKGKK